MRNGERKVMEAVKLEMLNFMTEGLNRISRWTELNDMLQGELIRPVIKTGYECCNKEIELSLSPNRSIVLR